MRSTMLSCAVVLGSIAILPSLSVEAQTLYGVSGGLALSGQFEWSLAGPPCAQPNPVYTPVPWPYGVPLGCAVPAPAPFAPPPAGVVGDVAVDRSSDTVFVTDGVVIEEYLAGGPCGLPAPGTPLNAFFAPALSVPPLPITGMGMGAVGAGRVLWITDGFLIAAIAPSAPGSCLPPALLVPPFAPGLPGPLGALTDLTWDPTSGTLFACDTLGQVHNIAVGGGPAGPSVPVVGVCGLGLVLQGLAFDTATPPVPPLPPTAPAYYVTDGFTIAYLTTAGVPAAPTFYTPVPLCGGVPSPLSGLAFAAHGISYGAPGVAATLRSTGQSTSPGVLTLDIFGAPAGSMVWLVVNSNVPGPGFACPPLPAVGTTLWVNPAPPAVILPIGPALPGCMSLGVIMPPGIGTGLQIYVQAIMMVPGAGAVDSTDGHAITIALP